MMGRVGSRVGAARFAVLLGSSAITALWLPISSASAQTPAPASPQPARSASVLGRPVTFEIAPRALSSGIIAFSRAAGVDLVFDGAVPG